MAYDESARIRKQQSFENALRFWQCNTIKYFLFTAFHFEVASIGSSCLSAAVFCKPQQTTQNG